MSGQVYCDLKPYPIKIGFSYLKLNPTRFFSKSQVVFFFFLMVMAWDHPNGLATAEIGDESLNGLSPLLMFDIFKSQTPFVKVWALAPLVWEKTQTKKKKKRHQQNPKESTSFTSSLCHLHLLHSTPFSHIQHECYVPVSFEVQHRKPNYWVPKEARNQRWPLTRSC